MNRCKWLNLNNPIYIKYHDEEWGVPSFSDDYLFEMLILESFQAGLSWECVLNKREDFRKAFDNFNLKKVSDYNENKIKDLMGNAKIIRNKLKIESAINNAKNFILIQKEWGSFSNYIWHFTDHKVIRSTNDKSNPSEKLSKNISKDLKKRGMKFVGTTIIYSYLQAIGIINDHEQNCSFYQNVIKL